MARRASKDDAATAGIPNSAEGQFLHHISLIGPLEDALEKAKMAQQKASGAYRNAIKAAKASGLDPDDLTEFLRLRKKDPEEVTRSFTNINNMLLWGKVPVGAQLGIFAKDGTTVATRLEDREIGDVEQPADDGPQPAHDASFTMVGAAAWDAGKTGRPNDGGGWADGTPQRMRWDNDWARGNAEFEALPPGEPADPAPADEPAKPKRKSRAKAQAEEAAGYPAE